MHLRICSQWAKKAVGVVNSLAMVHTDCSSPGVATQPCKNLAVSAVGATLADLLGRVDHALRLQLRERIDQACCKAIALSLGDTAFTHRLLIGRGDSHQVDEAQRGALTSFIVSCIVL